MIAWWAPPEIAAGLPAEIAGAVTLVDEAAGIAGASVVVLDTRAAAIVDLAKARATIAAPVVIVCAADEVDAALELIGDADDIAVVGEPPQLVLERARRAARRRSPDRDGLTGLATRRQLAGVLEAAVRGEARPLSLVIVDLDHFKRINDTHGHLAGDEVLVATARRLERALEPGAALLARIGGEEFAALLESDGPGGLRAAGEALAAIRAEPLASIAVTASAGVASTSSATSGAIEALWRGAEEALYAAKARGRDRVIGFDELRRAAAAAGRDLELDGFENRTRVMADKVADVIARRGRRLFGQLKEQAEVDGLTGLYNRRYLDRRLELEVGDARERTRPLSVALIDLDAFGAVNKEHGWPTGDRVLSEVAERIRANVRASDWVARYGGEEICVVMLETGLEQAAAVLERIRAAIESAPFSTTAGEPLAITASLGAAELDAELATDEDSVASLLERASARLLEAKGAGKNQVCV